MKKKVGFLLGVEGFILLVSFFYCIHLKQPSVLLGTDNFKLVRVQEDGETQEEESCYYDRSYEAKDIYIETSSVSLKQGVYRVTLSIETNQEGYDGDCISEILFTHSGFRQADSGKQFVKKENDFSFNIRVGRNGEPLIIRSRMNPDGLEPYLLLKEIRIGRLPIMSGLWGTSSLLFGILILNLCLLFYIKRDIIDNKAKYLGISLFMVWLLSSAPVFIPYLVNGHDIRFHLLRIEGLKDGMLSGVFPVKLQPNWLNGNGYPVSILYPDLFLYVPAFLRIAGISLQAAYQIYVLLVNAATVFISYWSFGQMSGRKAIGVLGALTYTLSLYHLANIYTRAAVGEYTAMVFMPLVLYALWRIYTQDMREKGYKQGWILLALSLTGIIQSHVISVEMTGIFILLICLILWKRTFCKNRFLVLSKAFAGTVLLNAWFLVPFLDYYKEDLVILSEKNESPLIQGRGIFLPQLFSLAYKAFGTGSSAGMLEEMPMTIGLCGILLLAACFWSIVIKKILLGKSEKICLILTFCAMLMCTVLFPYDFLSENIPLLGTLLGNIQYPFRFLSIVTLFLAWLACLLAKDGSWKRWIPFLCIVVAIQAWQYTSVVLNESEVFTVYGNADVSTFDISGGEYVPYGTDLSLLDRKVELGEGLIMDGFSQRYNFINVKLTNASSKESFFHVPLLYYRGYEAIDINSGNHLFLEKGDNNRIKITVPAGFSGDVSIAFSEPWYWRMAEIVSATFIIFLIVSTIFHKKRILLERA